MSPTPVMQSPEDQGTLPTSPEHAAQLQDQGYLKCLNPTCDYHFTPETVSDHSHGDQINCPQCKFSYDPLDTAPFARPGEQTQFQGAHFKPGGATIAGISLREQGQIGEAIVQQLGEIPGYGKLTWWSPEYHQPLDGAVGDWGGRGEDRQ